jgi:hypothetical protein
MAKVLTLPIKPEMPDPTRRKAKPRKPDPRYVEGQRLLVEAMRYLIKQDPQRNKDAVMMISEHVRPPCGSAQLYARAEVEKQPIFQILNIHGDYIHYCGFKSPNFLATH